jgi:hypothetical protein
MVHDVILACMLLSYSLPITLVYYKYSQHNSISSIVCDNDNKYYIFGCMFCMGLLSIMYEVHRGDLVSLCLILGLLIGIYGVICVKDGHVIHNIFAAVAFSSILGFMIYHSLFVCDIGLNCILLVQMVLALWMFYILYNDGDGHESSFFFVEVAIVLNFALFFIYLHLFDERFEMSRETSRVGIHRLNWKMF